MTDEQMEEILDALEVVILNIREDTEIALNVVNDKLDRLIGILEKII